MSGEQTRSWEQPGYSDITAAARTTDGVLVSFADGATVTIGPGLLGVQSADFSVEVDPDDPTRLRACWVGGMRDVDWSVIRAATDETFASELRARDTEESHRVGRRVRALRENRGLAQRDLAKLVGMPAPQLSKLEKGESDMRLSTVRSLLRAMGATFADISGPEAQELSVSELSRLAKKAGAPDAVVKRIADAIRPQFKAALSRGFGWSGQELDTGQLGVPRLQVPVLFKANSPKPHDSPLLPLAHTLSEISAALYDAPVTDVPSDPGELRRQILSGENDQLTLRVLLVWAWGAGILVIPMVGPSGFSAAAWNVAGRPVIVLKESRDMIAYWMFALAHELAHLALGHLVDTGVVELTASREADRTDPQEHDANIYALDLLLPGRATLIGEIRKRSEADGPRLFKGAVEQVAAKAKLNPAILGVVASYELTDIARPRDRWGSTENIGKPEGSGRKIAEEAFSANVSLEKLTDLDRALVLALVLSS